MPTYCLYCNKQFEFDSRRQATNHFTLCLAEQNKKNALEAEHATKHMNPNHDEDFNDSVCIPCDEDDSANDLDDENDTQEEANKALHERHQTHQFAHYDRGYGTNNPQFHSGVLLLDILQKAKCPLKVFDDIVEWARKSHAMGVKFDESFDPSHSKLLDQIDDLFDLHGLTPHIKEYTMTSTGERVPVVYIDFLEAIYSLLNDIELMNPDNLIDDSEDDEDDDILDDIHKGSVWKNAKTFYVKHPNKQKMIPIIFFIDKTHNDINGHLKLELLIFTIFIF